MHPLIPPIFSALLIGLTAWIGLRYFTIKNNKYHVLIKNKAQRKPRKNAHTDQAIHAHTHQEPELSTSSKGIDRITLVMTNVAMHIMPLAALILISILLAFILNKKHNIDNLIPNRYANSEQIKLVLEEEVLVPPPPLPPEAFTDAVAQSPSLGSANREWGLLNPQFVQRVLHVMRKLEERGYPMTLLEGYRSPERQDALAGQITLVTKAKGGQSKHQYGLAADLAPIKNGKIVISEKDAWAMAAYQALGEEAQAAGLTWGGIWRFRDYGHIEQHGPLHQQQGR